MLSVDDSSLQQEQFQLELQLIAEPLMKHVMRLSVGGKRGSNESLRRYGHSRILRHLEPPFWAEGEVVGDQRWHHSKERWWFPLRYL